MSSDSLGILEDYDADETPLPGMEPATGKESPMVVAARRTIAELSANGHVKEHHAMVCAMILAASEAIDRGSKTGRASAVAMAMKECREAYLLLVPAEEGGAQNDDGWSKFEAEFRKASELG